MKGDREAVLPHAVMSSIVAAGVLVVDWRCRRRSNVRAATPRKP